MTRTEARDFMMKVLFQMESAQDFNIDNKFVYFKNKELNGQKDYCENLYSLFCNKRDFVDAYIIEYSKWPFYRIPKTDLAAMRIATLELAFMKEIPSAVVINEAVEMSKQYGSEDSPKYVNAILSNILKDIEAGVSYESMFENKDIEPEDEPFEEIIEDSVELKEEI